MFVTVKKQQSVIHITKPYILFEINSGTPTSSSFVFKC